MSGSIERVLIHPSQQKIFSAYQEIWATWAKKPTTNIIKENDSLAVCSYVFGVPEGEKLLVGGQTANACVAEHLQWLARYLQAADYQIIVAVSSLATYSVADIMGSSYSVSETVERINTNFHSNFQVTSDI